MRKDIHPTSYREVLFKDTTTDFSFVSRSCARSTDTAVYEGKEYPVIYLGISSASHPFYTGAKTLVDTAGRVDKFKQRMEKTKAAQAKRAEMMAKRKAKKK